MRIPALFFKIIDPASAHFGRETPKPGGPTYHGGVVFGPDVPGGSRQATDDELLKLDDEPQVPRAYEAETDTVWQQYSDELRSTAIGLLAGETVTFTCVAGRLEARILRFWRGDSLLEVYRHGTIGNSSGRSLTRIGRSPAVDTIAQYLLFQVSKLLGPDPS